MDPNIEQEQTPLEFSSILSLRQKLAKNSYDQLEKAQAKSDDTQIRILSYFGSKDVVYSTLPLISRSSLAFLRRAFP
jgi:hypothetical protein